MHSVLITNPEGKILLSRYFDTSFRVPPAEGSDAENAAGFATTRDRALAMRLSESEVLEQTRHLWTKGTAECPQVARAKGGLIVVFAAVDGLLIFLCGSREYDELTLCDVLASLARIITNLCRQGGKSQRATEATLMSSSSSTGSIYSKACLAIDEMMPGGILESLDPDAILSAIKLQNPVGTTKQRR